MSYINASNIQGSLPFQFNEPPLTFSWIWLMLLAMMLSYGVFLTLKPDPYAQIPAVGGSSAFSAYFTRNRYNDHALELLANGYYEFKNRGIFRILNRDNCWEVVVTRADQIEDMRKASDDVLSFKESVNKLLFVKYLLGHSIATDDYHVGVVRSQLTKNLTHLFDGIREEIQIAFDDHMPLTDNWTSVNAYSKVVQIVARASNRVFIGLPLCREPEYLKVNIDYIQNVIQSRDALIRIPAFLRPVAARYFTTVSRSVAIALKYLGPFIEERRKKIEEYGQDYPDKPNDILSWLMEEASEEELSVMKLTNRILSLNFAAVHTSSMSFTHALYHLAAEPHYIQPLRKEIEAVIAENGGWSKVALAKMYKLDSFFKESQRYNGISFVSVNRFALKDFVFSDGTVIPKGTSIYAASYPIHHDDEKYIDGDKFDGFRFAKIRARGGLNTTNQFVNTSPDYISFGHGKHACPGRFFAANELKTMMAHLILNYDIKMENEGIRPANKSSAMSHLPDVTARVMFRRRQS